MSYEIYSILDRKSGGGLGLYSERRRFAAMYAEALRCRRRLQFGLITSRYAVITDHICLLCSRALEMHLRWALSDDRQFVVTCHAQRAAVSFPVRPSATRLLWRLYICACNTMILEWNTSCRRRRRSPLCICILSLIRCLQPLQQPFLRSV